MPCYDLERTICDTVRSRATLDPQTLNTALRSYVRRGDKQLSKLSAYAEQLGISGLVSSYLEILL